MLLGQIVAISFAMNLFFLALLLSLEPSIAEKVASPKSTAQKEDVSSEGSRAVGSASPLSHPHQSGIWTSFQDLASTPTRNTYTVPLLLNFISILFIPYTTHSPLFLPALAIPHILLFFPVVNTKPVPQGHHLAIYQSIFVLSLLLYVKATAIALLDDSIDVNTHEYLFAFLHSASSGPKHWQYRSGKWRFFGELFNHPAVSSVGWDVVLCWSSAIVWAVIQRPNSWSFLRAIVFSWRNTIRDETTRPQTETCKEASKDE